MYTPPYVSESDTRCLGQDAQDDEFGAVGVSSNPPVLEKTSKCFPRYVVKARNGGQLSTIVTVETVDSCPPFASH